MGLAYNPKNRANDFKVQYVVHTSAVPWYPVTTGYGDNPSSGTTHSKTLQCANNAGSTVDGTPVAEELVAS